MASIEVNRKAVALSLTAALSGCISPSQDKRPLSPHRSEDRQGMEDLTLPATGSIMEGEPRDWIDSILQPRFDQTSYSVSGNLEFGALRSTHDDIDTRARFNSVAKFNVDRLNLLLDTYNELNDLNDNTWAGRNVVGAGIDSGTVRVIGVWDAANGVTRDPKGGIRLDPTFWMATTERNNWSAYVDFSANDDEGQVLVSAYRNLPELVNGLNFGIWGFANFPYDGRRNFFGEAQLTYNLRSLVGDEPGVLNAFLRNTGVFGRYEVSDWEWGEGVAIMGLTFSYNFSN